MTKAAKTRAAPAKSVDPGRMLGAFLNANRGRFPTDSAFAEAVECSRGRLSQILHGRGLPNVRPRLAINIHRESNGAVPGNVLRPDLWRRAADVPIAGDQ